jgi:glycerol-1-phosphate dehydrogenase [NAD(P)+]
MGIYVQPGREFTGKCGRVHRIAVEKVLVGKGAIHDIPALCSEFGGGKRTVLVGDELTTKMFTGRIADLFDEKHRPEILTIRTSTMEEVEALSSRIGDSDLPLAVGGGAVIDTVKLASHRRGVRFVSVPTTPSHDGMVSPTASITVDGRKTTQNAFPPVAAVFDLAILSGAPGRMISAGYGDVFAKFTSLKDWELAHVDRNEYYCQDSVDASAMTLHDVVDSVLSRGTDIEAVCYGVINSGLSMVLAGTSRPESGSEHMVSHYIDQNSNAHAMHGEQVALAVLLLSAYHREKNDLWWKEAKYQPEGIREVMKRVGLPLTFASIGVGRESVARALVEEPRSRPEKYTILHKFPFDIGGADEFVRLSSI